LEVWISLDSCGDFPEEAAIEVVEVVEVVEEVLSVDFRYRN
jgi:hypothetical protein